MYTKNSHRVLAFIAFLLAFTLGTRAQTKDSPMTPPITPQVFYRTVKVDGLSIFYREAGPANAPTILLLHGLPSSSRMFEPLFARLADSYHLVAPDYPGFGHSDWPDPQQFAYTFDHIASVMDKFTETLGLSHYTLYMQDYGGPVGFRMILAHPERAQALIVQDAVSHNEGLGVNWKTRRAFWADRAANDEALRKSLLSMAATKTRHVGDDPNLELYDRISGQTNTTSSIHPARPRSKATFSTTIALTSTPIPNGRHGCRKCTPASSSSGASTTFPSIPASPNAIA
jgi:pimeloyl-ACP methyl ester carboxylesterase